MPRYLLNRKEGVDTLHDEHPWEVCNTDQGEDLRMVEGDEAGRLVDAGEARTCQHCLAGGLEL